jgi:hypothetical protein
LIRLAIAARTCSIVYEIALEILDLFVGEDDLGEFADPGVDPIHDLSGPDLLFEHFAAGFDAGERVGRQLDFLALPGDPDERFDGQGFTVEGYGHGTTPQGAILQ